MIQVEDLERFQSVVAFAKRHNLVPDLCRNLEFLGKYANGPGCTYDRTTGRNTLCKLGYDFAPYSFGFLVLAQKVDEPFQPWFNGGLIYSGPLDDDHVVNSDGSFPSLCVDIGKPKIGWRVHT